MNEVIIKHVREEDDIRATFPVMSQLRSHLDEDTYVKQVQHMQEAYGYQLVGLYEGDDLQCAAGFKLGHSLAWQSYMYVDDLVTSGNARSHGYGKMMFEWLVGEAKRLGCGEFHLDSGVQRHEAHRFYLRERMDIVFYHFAIKNL
ncbi:GNAT family N-acetyltransferase [Paenibacillus sp. KN14-4R]|uniref:GNAT family N-acetyltransferase n=1 Tax=Paenibacillus sp. KN14-4R TaxID=3445773 RepID=UPI003FA14F76